MGRSGVSGKGSRRLPDNTAAFQHPFKVLAIFFQVTFQSVATQPTPGL